MNLFIILLISSKEETDISSKCSMMIWNLSWIFGNLPLDLLPVLLIVNESTSHGQRQLFLSESRQLIGLIDFQETSSGASVFASFEITVLKQLFLSGYRLDPNSTYNYIYMFIFIYSYIYIYFVCVCVCVAKWNSLFNYCCYIVFLHM